MDYRLNQLKTWLSDSLSVEIESLNSASEDASFRRYFRVVCKPHKFGDDNSLIVMDAPPTKESLIEFISINNALNVNGIHVPKIHAINLEQGFLLLEDLGTRLYLQELHDNAEQLYSAAIESLLGIQNIEKSDSGSFSISQNIKPNPASINYIPPKYDRKLVEQELELFITWYCKQHLQTSLTKQQLADWSEVKQLLIEVFKQQPQVWVHRDFHSRNLMITNDNSPGVIDFQDMVWGPISYDLASIFKDCYIEWPRETQVYWLETYLDKLTSTNPNNNISLEKLIKWFDLTGLQRHIKVLGIFCRLNYRDSKSQYLLDLPLVEKYIHEVLAIYPELDKFKAIFDSLQTNDN